MIVLDLSILNQKGTPMFNSDIFANRPAFGIVGRIFISIDTAAIYRDTGTAWDLIADGGSSSTNIYNSNGTLSANRVVSDGGFGLSFTSTTHIGTASIGGGGSGKLIVGSSTADNGIQIFGANSPSFRIDNAQSGGTQRFVFGLATATNNFIQGATAGEFCISTQSAGNMLFGMWQSVNASEVMRITTTNNLLIGSSVDNGNRLQVLGTAYINNKLIIDGTLGNQYIQFYNSGVDRAHIYWEETTNSLSIGTYVAGGAIQFETSNNVDAMLLTSVGYLGLGVNPSVWTAGGKNIEVGSAGNIIQGQASQIAIIQNASFNSGWKYSANGFASFALQTSGQHQWYNAPSGTAGNSITFTQAMTLNSNGNLLVGTTTDAGQKLQVTGTAYISSTLGINVVTAARPLDVGGTVRIADGASLEWGGISTGIAGSSASNFILLVTNSLTRMTIKATGVINLSSVPASSAGLVSGDIFQTAGVLNIVP